MENNEVLNNEQNITVEAVQTAVNHVPLQKTGRKRILVGKVTSNKPDKTIIVSIERQVIHPLYKKYFKRTKKVMAHDPENTCKEGDKVRISECRPLSARKRWMLVEVVERAK